jgi:hypothetical protein
MRLFTIGQTYTRRAIQDCLGVPSNKRGGDWNTGYTEYGDAFYLFCNIGIPGRTGHDYGDAWHGQKLAWSGKTGARIGQPRIKRMISGDYPVLVFWRTSDRDEFTFAGRAVVGDVLDENPVRIIWQFPNEDDE